MKIKTSELKDTALNWAVAAATNVPVMRCGAGASQYLAYTPPGKRSFYKYTPTTNWKQGGPIIEREITKLFRNVGGTFSAMIIREVPIPPEDRGTSLALTCRIQFNAAGPTPLIAAMRCFVASRLGDEVEIPEELV